jgi:hypothetical protein
MYMYSVGKCVYVKWKNQEEVQYSSVITINITIHTIHTVYLSVLAIIATENDMKNCK